MYRYRSSISRSIQNFGFFFFSPKFTTIHRAYRNIVYPTQQYNTITTRTPARRARVSCHRSFDIKILYYYFYINLEEKKKRNKSRLNYIYYCYVSCYIPAVEPTSKRPCRRLERRCRERFTMK